MRGTFGLSLQQHLMAGAAIVAVASASPAEAQTRNFDVPAQLAAQGIPAFAKQAGVQIIASGNVVRDRRTNAVRGAYSVEEGLRILLSGTGLAAGPPGQTGIITIAPSAEGNAGAAAEVASSLGEGAVGAAAEADSGKEIVVTGSRLDVANRSVPVKTYSAQEIEESGKITAPDFLNTLPVVSVQSTQETFQSQGTTTVLLHGFPPGTTGLLLNGRRLAPTAGTTGGSFDLNGLPLAFIERIDILPSGSSAVYGSDAIAGAVNFVTKRNVSGIHLSANVGHAADYTDQNYSAALGKSWDRGSISVVASYYAQGALFGRDRDIIANADYRRFSAEGGIDRRVATCEPGNVFSATAGNLPGLSSTVAAIPSGNTGRPAIADFTGTQGTQNLCSSLRDSAIFPAVRREGILASGHYEVTGSVEAFTELLYTHANTSFKTSLISFNRTVPASNAFNPFGTNVIVRTQLAIPSGSVLIKDYFRGLVGLRGKISRKLHWELAFWRSQDHSPSHVLGVVQSAPLAAALASSDPATALNPFSAQNPGSSSVVSSVYRNVSNLFDFDVNVVDGTLRGQLFDLPAGPVSFAVGAEYQWQTYFNDPRALSPTQAVIDISRQVGAIYSELRLPVFGQRGDYGNLLDITLAGRYDHYNDFGGKVTPQVGIELRPVYGVQLRASYAKAFKAPQLPQLFGTQSIFPGLTIPDNGRPGSPITSNVTAIFGGNPQLRPETGDANTLGISWSGHKIPGLKVSMDYWWLAEDNRIASPSVASVLANPDLFPGRAVRDPSGVLQSVDIRFANFGGLRAEGLDLDLSYAFRTSWGEFIATANWVRTTRFDAAVTPGAPLVDRLGKATFNDSWALKDKANFGLGWGKSRFALHATARYIGPYSDYPTTPPNTNRLGKYVLFDLSGHFNLVGLGHIKYLQHAALTANVVNLFDKGLQYSNFPANNGYDAAQADLLGRTVRVGLNVDW